MEIIRPNKLNSGDKVAIIAPAGAVTAEKIEIMVKAIKDLSLVPVVHEQCYQDIGYLAGDDDFRLRAIHDSFKDDSIKAMFCVRGGYGCARLLDKLDYSLIRRNPKVLVGMSDITSLQAAILNKSGLITYSGPMSLHFNGSERKFALENLKAILMDEKCEISLDAETILKFGCAKGRLIGGALCLLNSIKSTDYDYDYDNAILFFEEVGAFKYVMDRDLLSLKYSDVFKKVKAIIVGQNSYRQNDIFGYSFEEMLKNVTQGLDIPIVVGAKFGHLDHHLTLPIGEKVELNVTSDSQIIKII